MRRSHPATPKKHRIPMAIFGTAVAVLLAGTAAQALSDTSTSVPPSSPHVTTATLPDLNDPAVRREFVCSFQPGYFSPPQKSDTDNTYCEVAE